GSYFRSARASGRGLWLGWECVLCDWLDAHQVRCSTHKFDRGRRAARRAPVVVASVDSFLRLVIDDAPAERTAEQIVLVEPRCRLRPSRELYLDHQIAGDRVTAQPCRAGAGEHSFHVPGDRVVCDQRAGSAKCDSVPCTVAED